MKIILNLPEWIDENQTLKLWCGHELVAFKDPKKNWKIKRNLQ